MKELKFRAFDKLTKKMSPAFALFGEFTLIGGIHAWQHEEAESIGIDYGSPQYQDSLSRLNDLEVMQSTGLEDKNGTLIFEGDIFRIEEETDGIDETLYVVIIWVQEWTMFCTLRTIGEYPDYLDRGIQALDEPMFWTYTLEDTNSRKHFLCGNLYQNAELLEK